jgi:hypothetical protein
MNIMESSWNKISIPQNLRYTFLFSISINYNFTISSIFIRIQLCNCIWIS